MTQTPGSTSKNPLPLAKNLADPPSLGVELQLAKNLADPPSLGVELQPAKNLADPPSLGVELQPAKNLADPPSLGVKLRLRILQETTSPIVKTHITLYFLHPRRRLRIEENPLVKPRCSKRSIHLETTPIKTIQSSRTPPSI
jgi:hypothetical protein